MIPAAEIRERHLQAHIGFDQPRDLHQLLPELSIGIARAVGRGVAALLDRFQQLHRVERLAPGSIEDLVARALVHFFESNGARRISHLKIVDAIDRHGIIRTAKRAGDLRPQADCAHGRFRFSGERPVEPAVAGGLHSRSARFHVILRVEMRAGGIGRACRVDDGQMAGVVYRFERLQRRMQAEEAVEIYGGIRRSVRLGQRQIRAQIVIGGFSVGNDYVQPIHGAALKNCDEDFLARAGSVFRVQRAREPSGRRADPHHRHGGTLEKYATCVHLFP